MKKMIALLPCLEGAGGIRVLLSLFEELQQLGYQIEIWSQIEGSFRCRFEQIGISVQIQQDMLDDAFMTCLGEKEDIFINTLQMFPVVKKVNDLKIPNRVFWWIHEPPAYFKLYENQIPSDFFYRLSLNIHVYAAGPLVHDHILEAYQYDTQILNFGVKEVHLCNAKDKAIRKLRFLLPSFYFDYLKGQDLLIKAILDLPQEYLERSEFYFLGIVEEDMKSLYQIIQKLEAAWGNVHYIPAMEHDAMLELLNEMDCIVAPSREDATNACVVEGLMLSKLCICSDKMGVSYYLKDGESAFIVPAGNVEMLKNKIMFVIDEYRELNTIRKAGYCVYQVNYSEDIFRSNIKKIFEQEDR